MGNAETFRRTRDLVGKLRYGDPIRSTLVMRV
jgi:hypothetical protein